MANDQKQGLSISCSLCGRSLDNIEYISFGAIRCCRRCGKPIPEKKRSSSKNVSIRRFDQDIWEENLKGLFALHTDYENHIYVAIDKRTGHPYCVNLQNIQYGACMVERMELVQIDYCGVFRLSQLVSLQAEIEGINYTNWQRYAEKMHIIIEIENLRKSRAFIIKCMSDKTLCENEIEKKLLLQQQLKEQYDKLFILNFAQKRKLALQIREIDRAVALLILKIPEEKICRKEEYAKELSLCDTEIRKKEQDLKNLRI